MGRLVHRQLEESKKNGSSDVNSMIPSYIVPNYILSCLVHYIYHPIFFPNLLFIAEGISRFSHYVYEIVIILGLINVVVKSSPCLERGAPSCSVLNVS